VSRRLLPRFAVSAKAALTLLLAAALSQRSYDATAAEGRFETAARPLFARYCFDCHNAATAEAQINLEQLTAEPAFNATFKIWDKVAAALEKGQMPPADAEQPATTERRQLVALVRNEIDRAATSHPSDPGKVALRRLTGAEYDYTIRDLTGLELSLDREFVSDAAGGEGFTNFGSVQFVDDAGLERYFEAAKKVAAHAVIGAAELQFFADPGKTGLELSAIDRIRRIYREHGFRTAAGEGGVPFGLDRYPRAFYVAWQYQHRERLGWANESLESLAIKEGVPPRFAEHVWSVLTKSEQSFPTSEVLAEWRKLPTPVSAHDQQTARDKCQALYDFMNDWQSRLARAVGDEEEAAILSENAIQVQPRHTLVARFAWMDGAPTIARLQFSVVSADPGREVQPVVVWGNPRYRFRRLTRRRDEPQPLTSAISPESVATLAFGKHPKGGHAEPQDFVTVGPQAHTLELPVPEGARGLEVTVDVSLDLEYGEDCVVRCTVAEGDEERKIKNVSALLANPAGLPFNSWRTGVVEFARQLPQVSHREPAPSDRDPIPEPFDNTYNMPERNFFHTKVKYHRDDAFLYRTLLDEDTRQRLDEAWADLLTSFEYYDILLRFVAEKYKFDLGGRTIATVDEAWIKSIDVPGFDQERVVSWRQEFLRNHEWLGGAESKHVDDALNFAGQAWRRPLTSDEQQLLRQFYRRLRNDAELPHDEAIRSLLVRILMAPAFLFRAERTPGEAGVVPLNDWELASRLSYFLWSAAPDDDLRRAAATGELHSTDALAAQARRMLRDPKARRLATEFFGQWLGFYQFDRYRGVDPHRFPEFNDKLKSALHKEAITFFEHIVRQDRPLQEILLADYTFLDSELSKHYGIEGLEVGDEPIRIVNTLDRHRGGLTSLGAILTATSAPLRTSPVKRGDWVLRRVMGTPVPPPPANAGSIAADEAPADGKTVRQRLEAHRQDAACVSCHSRIDPLGFALEHYDSLGRWRSTYVNGDPIDDALTLASGKSIAGPAGLREYLKENQPQFYRTLTTKLLAYALGRGELASDRELTSQMMADAAGGAGGISQLVVDIVTSRQFRHRRVAEPLDNELQEVRRDEAR
jgi:hypothetical protein